MSTTGPRTPFGNDDEVISGGRRDVDLHCLKMVRAGDVELRTFLSYSDSLPNRAWTDRTPSNYQPSGYALCHAPAGAHPQRQGLGDLNLIRGRISGTLQPLLAGTERSFADPAVGPWAAVDCFVLDAREAEMVWTAVGAEAERTS